MDIMEQLNAFWPIILMVVIFYFLLWRPQKKQQKKRQEMLESLKPGAKIVTVGGVMGNIVSLHDDYLVVRIADRVEIKITRAAVAQVLGKGEGKKAAKKAEKAAEKAAETKAEAPAEAKTEAAAETKEAEAKDGQ
ncbi:preprotein translocase subunit YajC [Megasphaera sp. WILCCON 0056]|uniref:preprotein translocase subunit YajC n=1 Tax=Megasphaera sp. WILCCON 0056 TaxID=3345340 RepID=UPI003A7F7C8F